MCHIAAAAGARLILQDTRNNLSVLIPQPSSAHIKVDLEENQLVARTEFLITF